ncbi:phytanoyl-CoA dioxygenase [Jannaschia pagri]|uniref:Phytanoyl-CoA dioxygenase n=1 Tax=Jannaschia pagri TaxID=2829797 RepID=A0ABQ4NR09_9RHOB|nr:MULTISPECIES: phytanoyl-CoA dioxygenase family protein [unclassified Jannaschia]GIT92854.1 phytanoyl-CoA dioxygenase [Jannaschia sp. AI_61]GIT96689.1 phytanoyl-CoA dioxygenase [Jannaschia sp. AI_62]
MRDQGQGPAPVWLGPDSCDLTDFKSHLDQVTTPEAYPLAHEIQSQIPIYDGDTLRQADADMRQSTKAEWNRAFLDGPGIIVIRRGYDDDALLDSVTATLSTLIAAEEAQGTGTGDHFASAGANSRLWNAHEKLAVAAPEAFVPYAANPIVADVAEAWLGPAWQMTTQVNIVRPGGTAQVAHRDYHMGFQTAEVLARYPASQHALSARLTLQGAVAHTDMPVISGPTKLLPYSQSYLPGYLAVLEPAFRDLFEARYVQLPLSKGDLLFFNPATFHAAGENRSENIQRFANLMQIGSAYGRSIEIVDRDRMCRAVYPTIREKMADLSPREVETIIAATAEGYPFPANLDLDSPLSGMAPSSQQDLMRRALTEGWTPERFDQALSDQRGRKRSH